MKAMLRIGLVFLFLSVLISCGGGGGGTPVGVIAVSPTSATVALGGSQQFSVTNNGVATCALPILNGVQGGNSTVGTIDANGKYTAPTNFPSPHTFAVTASVSGGTGTANVTVAFPNDNHTAESAPIKLGTSGGNATDFVDSGGTRTCCSGTLGALILRGGTFFILSNNHVLDKSGAGSPGDNIQQPGLVDNRCDVASAPPATIVANLSEAAALKPSPCSGVCTGPAPSNVDAAIAAIALGMVDTNDNILDLGAASSSSIAAAPPSSTLAVPANVLSANEGVAKSGRSTGLTCSTLSSVTTAISVDYNTSCGGAKAFTSTFTNQVVINGGSFSSSGDSGSLVVTSDTARPVGLLFAGNTTSTTANPIQDVITAFTNGSGTPVVVGGGDHSISCDPTTTASSATTTVGASSARLSAQETARVVYSTLPTPRPSIAEINHAAVINEARTQALMSHSGIQGVGVGVSDDNTAEPAIVIYVITGVQHPPIPAVIDGLRTKIIEGDRFRAFGWGKEAVKPACSQKPQSKVSTTAPKAK